MIFAGDLQEISARFAWNLPEICLRYGLVISLVTEWVTDMPGSRDAYTSKKS